MVLHLSYVLAGLLWLSLAHETAQGADASHSPGRSHYRAPRLAAPIDIDDVSVDAIWDRAEWRDINHRWLGPEYSSEDFQGRFKVAWTEERIYLLVELVDDILFDSHRNPLVQYWDDDCLEIFVDEDYSGGDHQYNHNAFAYHLSLDNQAIDIGTDEQPRSYSHHVESRWNQVDDTVIWVAAIDIYADNYIDDSVENTPVSLYAGKVMGLMLAYCDNDGSEIRENFIGSESVPDGAEGSWLDRRRSVRQIGAGRHGVGTCRKPLARSRKTPATSPASF